MYDGRVCICILEFRRQRSMYTHRKRSRRERHPSKAYYIRKSVCTPELRRRKESNRTTRGHVTLYGIQVVDIDSRER